MGFWKRRQEERPRRIIGEELSKHDRNFLRYWDKQAGLAWLEGKRPLVMSYEAHDRLKKILLQQGWSGENIVSRWVGVPAKVEFTIVQKKKENEKMDLTNKIGLGPDKEKEEQSNPVPSERVVVRVSGTDPKFCNRIKTESTAANNVLVWLCDRRKAHQGYCSEVKVKSVVEYVHKEEQ